jgi:perosamine synthetase
MQVPLSQPYVGEEEIQAVLEVLRSTQLSLGPQTEAFEQTFARTLGATYGIAINSGTSGLHVCVRALGLEEGDEVITTPFSFIASANCVLFERAKPVFVDVEYDTFNIDPEKIEAAITPRTKAIIPVHVFGQSANMQRIMEIARKHDLKVIEDACEAPLALHHGQKAGTFGDCAVYGFYPNKQMTTGEGGMIITNDESLYELCKSLRNQGRGNSLQWLAHTRLGYNYRISEMTAAMGRVQTEKLPGIIDRRREIAARYAELLAEVEEVKLPHTAPENVHAWFVYGLRVDPALRDPLLKYLNDHGVQSKAYFFPCIHLQEFYIDSFGYQRGDFPVAERLSDEILILPFFTRLTDEQMVYVVETLKDALKAVS